MQSSSSDRRLQKSGSSDAIFSLNDAPHKANPAGQNCTVFGAGDMKTNTPDSVEATMRSVNEPFPKCSQNTE
jgi:hypothetical protein